MYRHPVKSRSRHCLARPQKTPNRRRHSMSVTRLAPGKPLRSKNGATSPESPVDAAIQSMPESNLALKWCIADTADPYDCGHDLDALAAFMPLTLACSPTSLPFCCQSPTTDGLIFEDSVTYLRCIASLPSLSSPLCTVKASGGPDGRVGRRNGSSCSTAGGARRCVPAHGAL
ncbi:hypothetical protein FA95DRAFT_533218 [Auriscalpium vulgare]|uniref:Uncharacterized protein n=1 Tax=Auriscalpium vulgare TaxID=40419 RepID=A0ACB8RFV3_9AGAM|nr:hypothetical protein FA95DRAFT_533218 [Auriscalpium vulgare]